VVGDAKKTKGFAQQRTGAFLLTLGDHAVRPARRRQSASSLLQHSEKENAPQTVKRDGCGALTNLRREESAERDGTSGCQQYGNRTTL
jgi:hypothetical protein